MTKEQTTRSKTRVRGFQDEEMDFQLMRQLGATAGRGASIGECLALAAVTRDADPADWTRNFTALAERLEEDADERLAKGHGLSAADQYLRACNAFRAAEYYTDVNDPRHKALGLKSRQCFLSALKAESLKCEILEMRYKEHLLPGYFFPSGQPKCKTIIAVSGFDGTLEETYIQVGMAALRRGYNVLLITGPGQMDTYRFDSGCHFEPDFETAVGLFLDAMAGRPEINADRLALIGISFGGYFATRAASRDNRIKALVANSPIVNLHDYMAGFIGFDPAKMPDDQNFTLEDIPQIPETVMNIQQKNMAAGLMRRFGCQSFRETFVYMNEFTVQDRLPEIKIPCLGMVGEGEGGEPFRQYEIFLKQVGGPAAGKIFTAEEGADTHCQVGNAAYANAVMFDWLDEIFAC